MTQEEKELLLKDLSARLPYGVIIDSREYNESNRRMHFPQKLVSIKTLAEKLVCVDVDDYPDPMVHDWKLELCKPYLRSMSSMTEEEEGMYNLLQGISHLDGHWTANDGKIYRYSDAIDFLNEHHFDYRGLIEKGFALEAPKGMYNNN